MSKTAKEDQKLRIEWESVNKEKMSLEEILGMEERLYLAYDTLLGDNNA